MRSIAEILGISHDLQMLCWFFPQLKYLDISKDTYYYFRAGYFILLSFSVTEGLIPFLRVKQTHNSVFKFQTPKVLKKKFLHNLFGSKT